jgi:hypothetical protein
MVVPNIVEQHSAGHDLANVTHQIFEKAELSRLQIYDWLECWRRRLPVFMPRRVKHHHGQ